MSGSFIERLIDVTFYIGTGPNGQDAPIITTYSGLRVTAEIVLPGLLVSPTAQVSIYGLTQSEMNKLSSLGLNPARLKNNAIKVAAGDAVNGMTTVYQGTIWSGYVTVDEGGNAGFQVQSFSSLLQMVTPISATSYAGSVPVATIMAGLAKQMGYTFENNGVTTNLVNPYFYGTAFDQMRSCAKSANLDVWGLAQNKLAICPAGKPRNAPTPLISPTTGMIGYPSFASSGINVQTIFNPVIEEGCQIKIQSSLPQACGVWNVATLEYTLESQTPNGEWSCDIWALNPGTLPGTLQ